MSEGRETLNPHDPMQSNTGKVAAVSRAVSIIRAAPVVGNGSSTLKIDRLWLFSRALMPCSKLGASTGAAIKTGKPVANTAGPALTTRIPMMCAGVAARTGMAMGGGMARNTGPGM